MDTWPAQSLEPPAQQATAVPKIGSGPHHHLRAPITDFAGRTAEIVQLVAALGQAAGSGTVAAINGIRGMGGIGKTELAYLVANHVIDSFPDAQIVVSLYGTSATPLTPIQALQQVIHAFTPEAKLPDDLEALQQHYRSVLHHKRVLILADDAHDATQVQWLWPPTGCALLVTSRVRFPLPGMTTVDLEVLDEAAAVTLLRNLCSRLSIADAKHLARACGYLPLALRISGSLLHNDPALSIATHLARLADEHQRLTQLRDPDDLQLDVAATLALSYTQLDTATQQVFRQLGVLVADFSTELAQAVVVAPENADVVVILHGLLRRNLVMYDQARNRWWLHDLVRDLARQELEQQGEAEAVQWRYAQAAIQITQTIQDQYLAGGNSMLLALAQFDAERAHIDAARGWAQSHMQSPAGDQLLLDAALARRSFEQLRHNRRHEIIPLWERARTAAQRLGNQLEEARALNMLGITYADLGELHTAISYFKQRLVITREIGDRRGEGFALSSLGVIYMNLGKQHTAISYFEQSLAIAHELGDRRSEGIVLGNLGNVYFDLGKQHTAISYFEQSLAIAHELGDRRREGESLSYLSLTYMILGDIQHGIETCKVALTILREFGDQRIEGYTLGYLARAQAMQGNIAEASTTYMQASTLLQEVGDRWGVADCQWQFGLILAQHGEQERALPLLRAAVAYEQEIGHAKAEEHAALVAHLEAGEELPPELHIPTEQRAIGDDADDSTDNDVQP